MLQVVGVNVLLKVAIKDEYIIEDCICISSAFFFFGSLFAPISRQEAELIQQQAPPSYGQLIAQGIIPPVEDFPTENPNEVREKGTTVHSVEAFLPVTDNQ